MEEDFSKINNANTNKSEIEAGEALMAKNIDEYVIEPIFSSINSFSKETKCSGMTLDESLCLKCEGYKKEIESLQKKNRELAEQLADLEVEDGIIEVDYESKYNEEKELNTILVRENKDLKDQIFKRSQIPTLNNCDAKIASQLINIITSKNAKELCKFLEKDPNALKYVIKDDAGPIHLATSIGWIEGIDKMIQFSPRAWINMYVDTKDKAGHTPLMYASWSGKLDIARFLLTQSAQTDVQDPKGNTALHFATTKDMTELLVQSGAAIDAVNFAGESPLHAALKLHRNYCASYLISNGADINLATNAGERPLEIALSKNSYMEEMVLMLIRAGVDLKARATKGRSCAALLIRMGNVNAISTALEAGLAVNAPIEYGMTLLMVACAAGKIDIVKLLLFCEANANAQDSEGMTALMHSVLENHLEICQLLVSIGADAKLEDKEGRTALTIAQMMEDNSIENFLSQ